MTDLERIIAQHISANGPIDVGQFMSMALAHPKHGYYMKQDPFGRAGDFVTAPEVSQMFGEMLGLWAGDVWSQMNAPERFVFLECGPGRGTLMADMLRAGKYAQGFLDAAEVHLVEISPALKEKQAAALKGHGAVWHESLDTVPDDVPMIVIANELLDALPFRQIEQTEDGLKERVVYYEDGFGYGHRPAGPELTAHVPDLKPGEIFEVSPAREAFVGNVAERLKAQSGAALFIDYGHIASGPGDTFQAIKGHEFVDPLKCIGDADLTSHVDFEAIKNAAEGVEVFGPITQGGFLKELGIEVRAQALMKKAHGEQAAKIEKDLHRLINSDEMGTLFKVLGLCAYHDTPFTPAGF